MYARPLDSFFFWGSNQFQETLTRLLWYGHTEHAFWIPIWTVFYWGKQTTRNASHLRFDLSLGLLQEPCGESVSRTLAYVCICVCICICIFMCIYVQIYIEGMHTHKREYACGLSKKTHRRFTVEWIDGPNPCSSVLASNQRHSAPRPKLTPGKSMHHISLPVGSTVAIRRRHLSITITLRIQLYALPAYRWVAVTMQGRVVTCHNHHLKHTHLSVSTWTLLCACILLYTLSVLVLVRMCPCTSTR